MCYDVDIKEFCCLGRKASDVLPPLSSLLTHISYSSSSNLGNLSLTKYFNTYNITYFTPLPPLSSSLQDARPNGPQATDQICSFLLIPLSLQRNLLFYLPPLLLPALRAPLDSTHIRLYPCVRLPLCFRLPSPGCFSGNIPWPSCLV